MHESETDCSNAKSIMTTQERKIVMHSQHSLVPPAELAIWTDGSFNAETLQGSAAAILTDSNGCTTKQTSTRFTELRSSYHAELAGLRMGLHLIRTLGPRDKVIRIFTDSKT